MQLQLSEIYAITGEVIDITTFASTLKAHNIKMLQYRYKGDDANFKLHQACQLRDICQQLGVIFIINDDVALCQEIDADGVHLGKDDISVPQARKQLGNDKIIGVSCYNDIALAQRYAQQEVDYVAFGAMFPSITKPYAQHCTLEILTNAKKILSLPIVAIGGIDFSNKNQVLDAGADSVAMISALW